MVLTRSMATTNNVQGDEPRSTALERQVQTLTAAVERLTKQNQDLKEKLRQKNAGHGTQQEVPSKETKRGRKVVMPQADQSDKI